MKIHLQYKFVPFLSAGNKEKRKTTYEHNNNHSGGGGGGDGGGGDPELRKRSVSFVIYRASACVCVCFARGRVGNLRVTGVTLLP